MPKLKAQVSARRMITARRCKAMVTDRGCIGCISMPTFARYDVALLEYYCRKQVSLTPPFLFIFIFLFLIEEGSKLVLGG